MYEYQEKSRGLGLIRNSGASIFGRGAYAAPPSAPGLYQGIVPANAGIFGSGIGVTPARPPSTDSGIESCATGNCSPLGLGAAGAANGRPWWYYAAIGAGVGLSYLYLKRSGIMRNPLEELTEAEAIKQAAAITIQAGIPTILWGPPGIGKTQWVYGLGQSMAFMNGGEPVKVVTVIGSTKDPTDIGGMPKLEGGYYPPSWAEELRKRSEAGLRSILFLDEFSSMSPIVHAALLRVVNEKVAGETRFDPKGDMVHIVMAANRKKHGADARDLPPPAANRIVHFEWPQPTAIEWAEGMLFGWKSPFYFKLPEDWRKNPLKRKALKEVAAFLRYREGVKKDPILMSFPDAKAIDKEHGGKLTGGAWPSPRSWELAAQALGACEVAGAPKSVQLEAVIGAVGTGAAYGLFGFRKFEDLPDPEKVLKNPKNWDVPEEEIRLFIASNAIANAVREKPTLQRYKAAWEALEHALDTTDDASSTVMAAEQLILLRLEDPDTRKGWMPPPSAIRKYMPSLRAMGYTRL